MPLGPTNQSITIEWYQDSGDTYSQKDKYDEATYQVWFQPNPRKQEISDLSGHADIVASAGRIQLTDKPKHPIEYRSCLIVINDTKYYPAVIERSDGFGISYHKIDVVEHGKETP